MLYEEQNIHADTMFYRVEVNWLNNLRWASYSATFWSVIAILECDQRSYVNWSLLDKGHGESNY